MHSSGWEVIDSLGNDERSATSFIIYLIWSCNLLCQAEHGVADL